MKKYISILLIAIILVSGCSHNTLTGTMKTEFNLSAQIEYNNLTSKANITRDPYCMIIEYQEPSTLAGVTYTFESDTLNISFDGINSTQTDMPSVGESSCEIIYFSIEDAIPKGGKGEINGVTQNGTYSLIVNDKSLPEQLTLKDKNFKCSFS